ncbi:MAG: GyrI-like domain-containing protein, partial [Bdellovibrionales bacterium]|nr:GyrI-like domain-containing protein [Bdellovibrionales bacterium]
KFQLTNEFLIHLQEKMKMKPSLVESQDLHLIGFKKPFRGVFDENSNNQEVIPKLWQELVARMDEIPNKKSDYLYGVIECNLMDGADTLEYMAAVAVENFKEVPVGMTAFTFTAGKIAKFSHIGSPSEIDKTVKYIFGTWLPQSSYKLREGLELEIYPHDYDPTDPNCRFEYCLALQ